MLSYHSEVKQFRFNRSFKNIRKTSILRNSVPAHMPNSRLKNRRFQMDASKLHPKKIMSGWNLKKIMAMLALIALTIVLAPTAFADLLVSSYLFDGVAGSVLRYDEGTGAFLNEFVPPGSGGLFGPKGLVFGPDGNLYVVQDGANNVLRYDGKTGMFIGAFFPPGSGGLLSPDALVFGPDGNLYVTSSVTNSILRYNGSTGVFIDAFVPTGHGGLVFPLGLVFGPDGNLCVSSSFTGSVIRYDGTTGAFIDTFVPSGSGGLSSPYGLVFGLDGHLYVSGAANDAILRYDGRTGIFVDAFVHSGSGGLNAPVGLAFGSDGNLYVSNPGTNSVLYYNGTTGAFIDAFVPSGSGGLNSPQFLVFTPLLVSIDIKPRSLENRINPRSHGIIQLAILTTTAFDATTVDPLSVRVGPKWAPVTHGRGHIKDVDGDSDLDLVLHFETQDTGIVCGNISVFLTGKTFSGHAIEGTDSIKTKGCKWKTANHINDSKK